MSISTTLYAENDELVLVEVFVNGVSVGVCEEHAVENMLFILGWEVTK